MDRVARRVEYVFRRDMGLWYPLFKGLYGSVLIWCAVEKAQESSEGKDLTR